MASAVSPTGFGLGKPNAFVHASIARSTGMSGARTGLEPRLARGGYVLRPAKGDTADPGAVIKEALSGFAGDDHRLELDERS